MKNTQITTMKYILAIILALFIVSCSEDNVFNDATLDISETTINFSQEGSEKSVTIRTNAHQWSAFSAQEGTWFKMKKEGDRLVFMVEKNEIAVDRKAYAIVTSGNTVAKIELIQSGAEEVILPDADAIVLGPNVTMRKVAYESNADNMIFKVEDAPWMSISHHKGDGYFILNIAPNEGLYAREGTLLISSGKGVKSIFIKQEGTLSLIIPPFAQVAPQREVMRYEAEKGNTLVKIPNGIFNKTEYNFYTGVREFPYIAYFFKTETSTNYYSVIIPTSKGELFKGEDFERFLYSYGFVKTATKPDRTEYINERDHFNAFVKYESSGAASINIEYDPQQPQDYPTFKDGIPPLRSIWEYAADDQEDIHGKNKADVIEYEAQNGGVKNDILSKPPTRYWFYEIDRNDGSDLIARAYKFYDLKPDNPFTGQISEIYGYYDNVSLAYWEYDGDWKMTKEFRELLDKNNIVFIRRQFGHFFYHHKESNTTFDLTPMRFANFKNGKQLLVIRLYREVIND